MLEARSLPVASPRWRDGGYERQSADSGAPEDRDEVELAALTDESVVTEADLVSRR